MRYIQIYSWSQKQTECTDNPLADHHDDNGYKHENEIRHGQHQRNPTALAQLRVSVISDDLLNSRISLFTHWCKYHRRKETERQQAHILLFYHILNSGLESQVGVVG